METVGLDVLGLPAGEYQVLVNGVKADFALDLDNVPQVEATPVGRGSISGRVWHDLCAVSGGEGGEQAVPSTGCIDTGSGFIANGLLEPEEPGIPEIQVDLARGECPGESPMSSITDASGAFNFTDLSAGTYCLSVDAQNATTNEPILLPGGWTEPSVAEAVASRPITLEPNENILDQNFGWDYKFLPEPEGQAACTNLAEFVTDVSIPDNAALQAGTEFRKTWRIRNAGTCTWTRMYSLVFDRGDQMGGPDTASLAGDALPDETVDLSVNLAAPEAAGSYQGFWRLQTPQSVPFGIGEDGDESFWVRIKISAEASLPELGTPTWQDGFSSGANWPLFNDEHSAFSVEDGALQMTAKNPDWWNGWMLSRQLVDDYILQASFKTGECSGYDHYGLVFRAPDAEAGYLFTVSCHGYFTLWYWDGEGMNILKEWSQSLAIKPGAEQTNSLQVNVEGETFTLFVNDIELAQVSDSSLDGRKFGLFIGSAATEDFTVEVDQIAYWALED
jgi:hypothetical protein